MLRNVGLFILCLCVFGCADGGQLAPPDYDPPSNNSAKAAYLEALRIDGYENIDVGETPESANALNYQQSVAYNERRLTRKHTQTALSALRKIELGECEWRKSTKGDVPKWARQRITMPPSAVYECAYTLSFQINPPYGDKKTATGRGAFFKQDGRFVYMGRMPNPYS